MSTPANIQKLHALYVALTGLEIRLDMAREREWFEWARRGFTEDDLRLVILHIKRGITAQKRNPGALKFRNLICQPDYFEEDLAEAKSLQTVAKRQFKENAAKASVLRATGRDPAPPSKPVRTAAEVLETPEAKAFFNLRKQLGGQPTADS